MTDKSKRKIWMDGPYPYIHSEVVPVFELFATDNGNIFHDAIDKCVENITRLMEEESRVPTKFTVLLRADTLPMGDEDARGE